MGYEMRSFGTGSTLALVCWLHLLVTLTTYNEAGAPLLLDVTYDVDGTETRTPDPQGEVLPGADSVDTIPVDTHTYDTQPVDISDTADTTDTIDTIDTTDATEVEVQPLDIPDVTPPPDTTVVDTYEDEPCIPDCAEMDCGSDGCGGSCGGCDDGDGCTEDHCTDDACVVQGETGWTCEHTSKSCDDEDPCTADYCAPFSGTCYHYPVGCPDGDPCTVDHCDPMTGDCSHTPMSCPQGTACENGICVCQPDCSGKPCGEDNECGQTCSGPCPGGEQTCEASGGGIWVCECTHAICGEACCAENEVCAEDVCCLPACVGGQPCGAPDGCGGLCDGPCAIEGQICKQGACECDYVPCGDGCCPVGTACEDGQCVPCDLDCECKLCGDPDGCGGPCEGFCPNPWSETCIDGECLCKGWCDGICCPPHSKCQEGECVCLSEVCEDTCCDWDEVCVYGVCEWDWWWNCISDCSGSTCGDMDGCGGLCKGLCPWENQFCSDNFLCTCLYCECDGQCCDHGEHCVDGACQPCVPTCEDQDCGAPDGCGGTCDDAC